jgi:hypothetical protein
MTAETAFGPTANRRTEITVAQALALPQSFSGGDAQCEVVIVAMVPVVDYHRDSNSRLQVHLETRSAVLARYRDLRAIANRHQNKSLDLVSTTVLLQQARRLGMSDGRRLTLGSMSEVDLVYDLLVFTAPPGRSRALDRYARKLTPPPGSDDALVLDAMCKARFAVLMMERRHPVAGIIFADLFRNEEIWLIDEGLEASLEVGSAYATRYYTPDQFSMAAGVGVPVHHGLLMDAVEAYSPQLLRKSKAQLLDDPRLPEAVYRAAIEQGVMESVAFVNPPAEGYA